MEVRNLSKGNGYENLLQGKWVQKLQSKGRSENFSEGKLIWKFPWWKLMKKENCDIKISQNEYKNCKVNGWKTFFKGNKWIWKFPWWKWIKKTFARDIGRFL